MIKDLVIALASAGFPYMSVDMCEGKGNTLYTEIRVGGRNCNDGYLCSKPGNGKWTGHFYGVKFTLTIANTCWLVENAYEIAYIKDLQGRRISDSDVELLKG